MRVSMMSQRLAQAQQAQVRVPLPVPVLLLQGPVWRHTSLSM
jgi:hypothetical protein